jgi:hypothetical protein
MANGFEKQPELRALDDQRVDVEKLNVREQSARVLLSEFWVSVFVGIGVPANQTSVEQSTTRSRVGDGQGNAAQGAFVVLDGLSFGFVVHVTVLGGFGEIQTFDVLPKAGWQVAHQEVGLLNGFLRVDQIVFDLRADDGVCQTRRRWVSAARGTTVGLGVVAGKKMVENVAGVGEKVGWKGWPILGEQGRNGLKGPEGFFPRSEPNIDLEFAVFEASVQSCVPSADSVLQCPHQTDGKAFSL